MAGLWERIKPGADDRVSVHLLESGLGGVYIDEHSDPGNGFTRLQVRDAINSLLASPLTAGEEADLVAIADVIDGLANNNLRQDYLIKLNALTIAAEMGVVTEATFRTKLGI